MSRLLAVVLWISVLIAPPCHAEEGHATAFIMGEGGMASVDTSVSKELNKKGMVGSFLLGGGYRRPSWEAELGLGFSQSVITGTSATGLVAREQASARALAVDLGLRLVVWRGLGIGAVARTLTGEGVQFAPESNHKKVQKSFFIAPQLNYTFDFGRRVDLRITYYTDVSIPARTYTAITLGLAADIGPSIPLADSKDDRSNAASPAAPVVTAVASAATPTLSPPPNEAPEKVSIRLGESIIAFKLGSAAYDRPSANVLRAIGTYLAKTSAQWGTLVVAGHTDASGKKPFNLHMSLARAENVIAAFAAAGVDATRIHAVGYGSRFPLIKNQRAGGFAPENRRVELQFDDVSAPEELRKGLEDVIKTARERQAP